jgi:hypothetical protein
MIKILTSTCNQDYSNKERHFLSTQVRYIENPQIYIIHFRLCITFAICIRLLFKSLCKDQKDTNPNTYTYGYHRYLRSRNLGIVLCYNFHPSTHNI